MYPTRPRAHPRQAYRRRLRTALARSGTLRHARAAERGLDPLPHRGRTSGRRQNPHTKESRSGLGRLDSQAGHRQSGRLLAELRRLLPGPLARPVRAAVSLHRKTRIVSRAPFNRCRRTGGLRTEEPVARRHQTHLFNPRYSIARLAALVPTPRVNLTRHHGVFAPSSPMRRAIVPTPANDRRRRKRKDSSAASANRPCSSTELNSDRNVRPLHR
jgi:hypothetical protein